MYEKAMLHFGRALDFKPSATDVATIKVIGLFQFIYFFAF
jgi:anaphase-promoting complex subunit 3